MDENLRRNSSYKNMTIKELQDKIPKVIFPIHFRKKIFYLARCVNVIFLSSLNGKIIYSDCSRI